MKEAIEFLEDMKEEYICSPERYEPMIRRYIEVINLFKRGEKFEQIIGELKGYYGRMGLTDEIRDLPGWELRTIVHNLEQKYFPKSKKEDRPIKMERMDYMEKGMADIFGLKKHFPKPLENFTKKSNGEN